jgi:hypothetical protein
MIVQPDHCKATGQPFSFFVSGIKAPNWFAKLHISTPVRDGLRPGLPPLIFHFLQVCPLAHATAFEILGAAIRNR